MLKGRILITGGSGFLGRGILRRIRKEKWPAQVTVYSRDETKQFEVKRRFPEANFILGDVRDRDRLDAVMVGHDYVIHAGAVKYIPEAEQNVAETIAVNVDGSLAVARAAARAGVKTVVGVSTDKACSPQNTYGATKMLMERAFSEANTWSPTRFVTVRYGNVVGSTGSVVPMFLRQIRETGEVRITDPRMTRFWLSIDDAIDLIDRSIQYETLEGVRGVTLVPSCPAMSLLDLAQACWKMSDKSGPVKVYEMGSRPGEKLAESLFNEQEAHLVGSGWDSGWVLYPTLWMNPINPAGIDHYSSDSPLKWLSVEEMIAMIEDAKDVWL